MLLTGSSRAQTNKGDLEALALESAIDEQGDQFIVQKHYAESLHGDVWRGQSYLTTKGSLIKACVRLGCLSGSNQWLLLDALPSTVREYAAQIGLPR
jgi:hypothetical protein